MTLDDWLTARRMAPAEFAQKIGVNRTTVNRWLGPTPTMRPGWDLFPKILEATDGAVTANDFMPEEAKAVAEAAARRPSTDEALGNGSARIPG